MKLVVHSLTAVLVAGAAAGCAQLPDAPVLPEAAEVPGARATTAVLAGELAARRGDFASASGYYLAAARLSGDAEVAAQATRVALAAQDLGRAEAAAKIWAQVEPDSVPAHEILARMSLRHGEIEPAVAAMKAWLELLPADAPNRFEHAAGLIVAESEDSEFRLQVIQRLAGEYAGDPDAQLAVARVALDSGRSAHALTVARELLASRPEWVDALLVAVQAALDQGNADVGELVAMLHRVHPDDVDLRLHLARLMLDADRYDDADAEFAGVLQVQPGNSNALMGRGLLAMDREDADAARRWFRKLYEGGERTDDAAYYLGRLEEGEGNVSAALKWYQRVRHAERRYEASLRRARILARAGQLDDARRLLDEVRAAFPQHRVQSFAAEGEILFEAGESDAAIEVFNAALEEYPQQPDLLYGRALSYERLGRIDQAEADLREMIDVNPDDSRALNALGYVLSNHTARYDEALTLVERALALEPNDPSIIDSLGWLQFKLGHLDEALANLREAHRLFPDPEVAAHLGEVLWVSGRRDEAEAVWQQALQADPNHPVLTETVNRLRP